MFLKQLPKFRLSFFLLLFLLSIGIIGCGGVLDPCVNFDCPSGEVCVDVDGTAECQVPSNGGGGSGEEGDTCESDDDCASGLVCTADVDGVLTCEPG